MTKFSVITPSYNQSPYIAETIKSVLSQKGDFTIEYFVIDGGSTDGSVEIIEYYANLVKSGNWFVQCNGISMRWVSQKDNGQSDAINNGMRDASGDIISYINSDDLYISGTFAHVAAEFIKHLDADFVYGDGNVIDEQGKCQWEWLSRPYDYYLLSSYHFLWNSFTNYILQQSVFWRRDVIRYIGYFDVSFDYAMDLEYWLRAGQAGLKFHHTPYKLGEFRMISGTKSLSGPLAFWKDQLEIYRRYRGSRKLSLFFAYYFFNLALQFDLDLDQTKNNGDDVLARWRTLSLGEQNVIFQQYNTGFRLACILVANEKIKNHFLDDAIADFYRGYKGRYYLLLHPYALLFMLRVISGSKISDFVDDLCRHLIRCYRNLLYDFRYLPQKAHQDDHA